MSKLREDHPFNDFTPVIEVRAKELALERGHRDVNHIVICSDGVTHGLQVPIWKFYIAEAKLEAESADLCSELDRLYGTPPLPQADRGGAT